MNKNTKLAFLCAMIIGMTSCQTLPISFTRFTPQPKPKSLSFVKRIGSAPFRLGKRVLMPLVRNCATHKKLSYIYAGILAVGAVKMSFHVPWTWNKWLRVGAQFPRFGSQIRRLVTFFNRQFLVGELVNASHKGCVKEVDCLLRIGVDANGEGYGRTPLFSARTPAVVRRLVQGGAQVDKTNGRGDLPIHIAVNRGRVDIVECLIANGADVNSQDRYERRPLDYVLDSGIEMQKYLFDHGAEARDESRFVMARKRFQKYPLMLAFTQARHPRLGAASLAKVLPLNIFQGIWNSLNGMPAE